MSYSYSQTNRLEEPHSYMYAPFQGEALLQSYQSSRIAVLHRRATAGCGSSGPDHLIIANALSTLGTLHDVISLEIGNRFQSLMKEGGGRVSSPDKSEDGLLGELANGLERITTNEQVTTLDLLRALIALQLSDDQIASTKVWIDRLVQRFEVTKKLYESYRPGFRKGEGTSTSVRLYWLLALSLSLFYVRSNEIKYLSTLLKISDLLCSLPADMLQESIPEHGLLAVLATEIIAVQRLSEKAGVTLAFT